VNDDRVDQLLRRAADDVNAMVRSVTPPPIDDLGGRRSWPAAMVTMVSILLVVAGGVGLVLLVEHDDVVAPAAPPIDEARTTPVLSESLEHPCHSVIDISDILADPPTSIPPWVDLGVRIDELEARVATANPSEPAARRYERFVALARQAAELGAAGGFTPARLPAGDAVAVAEDLVEFVAVRGCQFPQTEDDPPGG
jgi:hypothetical protein